jgi:hypothetical protein
MRGLTRLHSARVISTGHAFVQNPRRGHYELGVDADPRHVLAAASANSRSRSEPRPDDRTRLTPFVPTQTEPCTPTSLSIVACSAGISARCSVRRSGPRSGRGGLGVAVAAGEAFVLPAQLGPVHGGPLPRGVLGGSPEYLPHGRTQAGDRRLKIHELRDSSCVATTTGIRRVFKVGADVESLIWPVVAGNVTSLIIPR